MWLPSMCCRTLWIPSSVLWSLLIKSMRSLCGLPSCGLSKHRVGAEVWGLAWPDSAAALICRTWTQWRCPCGHGGCASRPPSEIHRGPRDAIAVQLHCVNIAGAEAPTPAAKWVNTHRRYRKLTGCHWTMWPPVRGTRRLLWLQWLWGNARCEGCAAPWDKSRTVCSEYHGTHGQAAHKRLFQCSKWKEPLPQAWANTWER